MNLWIWLAIWAAILTGTAFAYWTILSALKDKSARVLVQLERTLQAVQKLEAAVGSNSEYEKPVSALERNSRELVAELAKVQQDRSKAKEARSRRLIRGLKNLKYESEN